MIPYAPEAYQLLHDGCIALAQVESNGMRIDTDYLGKAIIRTEKKIKLLTKKLSVGEVYKVWKKAFGHKTNLGSNDQLGIVLFDRMGFECINFTPTGKFKTDEATLATVDHPFVDDFLKIKKLEKALGTYLKGIRKQTHDGFLHPVFNLHFADTFRSSSDSPNFQNIPVRNKVVSRLVRRAICARHGWHLVEIDYSGVEVSVACCYHRDPAMHAYLEDKTTDMHRDMAAACFKLKPKQVTKTLRYLGKNRFVFPQFYGSWYVDCARELWAGLAGEILADGTPVLQHLARKGVRDRGACKAGTPPETGTFEAHIQSVEKHFWTKRFPVYAQWKNDWYDAYKKQGWFISKTGFVCRGFMKRNEAINYPVQGSAFHCLLWSLIRLQKELTKRKMKTLIVGQIHDSIVADSPAEELEDFLGLAQQVMVTDLMKAWPWIVVPLAIDAEVTPVGGSWYEKKERPINA